MTMSEISSHIKALRNGYIATVNGVSYYFENWSEAVMWVDSILKKGKQTGEPNEN